jgi:hypothetical protein
MQEMNILFEILVHAYGIEGYDEAQAYELAEDKVRKFNV